MNRCSRTSKLYNIRQSIVRSTEDDKLSTRQMLTRVHNEASKVIGEAKKYKGAGIRRLGALVGA